MHQEVDSAKQLGRWLSVEEIANHLGVSKESIYRWLEKGRIPAHRVGKLWRFDAGEIDDWIRRGEAADEAVNTHGMRTSNGKTAEK